MHTTARHLRNDRIIALRSRGWKIAAIAREVGVTERQCGRILNERREPKRSPAAGGGRVVRTERSDASSTELLDEVQSALDDLAAALTMESPLLSTALRARLVQYGGQTALDELRRRSEEFMSAVPERRASAPTGDR